MPKSSADEIDRRRGTDRKDKMNKRKQSKSKHRVCWTRARFNSVENKVFQLFGRINKLTKMHKSCTLKRTLFNKRQI